MTLHFKDSPSSQQTSYKYNIDYKYINVPEIKYSF